MHGEPLQLSPEAAEEGRIAIRDHLRAVLDMALAAKAAGTGAAARPEADPGLLELVCLLDEFDPDAGWRARAYSTLFHSIHDHLRSPVQGAWPTYTALFERDEAKQGLVDMAWFAKMANQPDRPGTDKLLHRSMFDGIAGLAKMMLGGRDPATIHPYDTSALRTTLPGLSPEDYAVLELHVGACAAMEEHQAGRKRGDTKRLGKKKEAAPTFDLDPLPPGLPAPLWRNERIPPMPKGGAKVAFEIGWCVCCTFRDLVQPLNHAAFMRWILGGPAAEQWMAEKPSRTEHLVQTRMNFSHRLFDCSVWGVPALDVTFGGDAHAYPAAVLAGDHASRHCAEWGARTRAVSHEFITGAPVNRAHWEAYAQTERSLRTALGDRQYRVLIGEPPPRGLLPYRKSDNQHDCALGDAFDAIFERDVARFNDAIAKALASHRRAEASYNGIWKHLDFASIGAQRAARRAGLDPEVPDAPPNCPALVAAPDPTTPAAPWSVLPGLELLARTEPQPALAWPTLYVNRPITAVTEPQPQ